jgi:hypothetical protein
MLSEPVFLVFLEGAVSAFRQAMSSAKVHLREEHTHLCTSFVWFAEKLSRSTPVLYCRCRLSL